MTGGGTGVSRVTDLKNDPGALTEADGTLFFVHDAGNFDRKLYKIESGSATVVKGGQSPSDLTEVGNTLFFTAAGSPRETSSRSTGAPGLPNDPDPVLVGDHLHWLAVAGLLWGIWRIGRGTA